MTHKTYQKQKRVISKKITNSAKGEDCTLRIPGVCNHNPETTVFAHMNGGGMGYKHHDIHGCYACSACHAWVDGEWTKGVPFYPTDDLKRAVENSHYRAVFETQSKLIQKGLIKI